MSVTPIDTRTMRTPGNQLPRTSDTHCIHGVYVGTWAGPDYMCGYCEMGLTTRVVGTRYVLELRIVEKEHDGFTSPWFEAGRRMQWTSDNDALHTWARLTDYANKQPDESKYPQYTVEYRVRTQPDTWWEEA